MQNHSFVARHAVVPVALAAVLAVAAPVAAGGSTTARTEAGMGIASVFANLFYVPMKLGYAAIGGLTGGLGWAVSGGKREVADRIWIASIGGDYVLTREMLAGEEAIHFIGTTGGSAQQTVATGKSAPGGTSLATVQSATANASKPAAAAKTSTR